MEFSTIQNSKMIKQKHGKYIFEDNKPILNCSHKDNDMFYRCPDYDKDKHLHCIRCGVVLKDNIRLRCCIKHSKIYDSKVSHDRLIDHIQMYSIPK